MATGGKLTFMLNKEVHTISFHRVKENILWNAEHHGEGMTCKLYLITVWNSQIVMAWS